MTEKIVKINPQQAKINSQVVDHVLKGMEFNTIDDFLIKNYSKGMYWGILFAVIVGGFMFSTLISFLNLTPFFFYTSVVFGLISAFLLFMFIYKAIMMNLYIKIRKGVKNIQEYETFTKILLKNSYQFFSDEDVTDVLNAIDRDNERALNGEKFSISNIFKLNGDDKVLIAVSSFRQRKATGKELV